MGMDTMTITAGILHDIIEDSPITEKDLEKEFGKEIVFLVNGVTKLGKLKYRGEERHVESLRKFFIAMAEDIRVLIIKLADRLHNLQTLGHLPSPEKRKRIALESIEVHAALANRMGMGRLKGDIEDLAFPYAFPEEYKKVEELLEKQSGISQKNLEEVHQKLIKELKAQNIKVELVDYRIKHKYSLYKKLLKYKMDIDKIYDIVALRVIVMSLEDCYRVLGIVHTLWKPMPGRIKDYIALPKPNGYQSLHTTIFTGSNCNIAEIQIRTKAMHLEDEYGVAAHIIYKESKYEKAEKGPKLIREKMAWLNELKDLHGVVSEPTKFLEHLKMDFFKDRIFVFTPKAAVVDLPEDACVIDFAYAIHSDIGNHTSSAKINGKMATLHAKLKNGDSVEIIHKKDAHPSSKWLEFAQTTMAKKHIRAYLAEHSLLSKLKSFGNFK